MIFYFRWLGLIWTIPVANWRTNKGKNLLTPPDSLLPRMSIKMMTTNPQNYPKNIEDTTR